MRTVSWTELATNSVELCSQYNNSDYNPFVCDGYRECKYDSIVSQNSPICFQESHSCWYATYITYNGIDYYNNNVDMYQFDVMEELAVHILIL